MAGPGTISFTRTDNFSSISAQEGALMRQDMTFSDFEISTNHTKFPCHRYVVSLHSEYLKAMLTTDMAEASKKSVDIDHIDPSIMAILIDYMYTGQISFHADQLTDVIYACHYMRIQQLLDMCTKEVISSLAPFNAIEWMRVGKELDIRDIIAECKKVLILNFKQISHQADFATLTVEELEEYLQDVRPDHHNDLSFQAVMRWVSHDTDERICSLEQLLKKVDLEDCSLPVVIDAMDAYDSMIVRDMGVHKILTEAMKTIARKERRTERVLIMMGGQCKFKANPIMWKFNQDGQFEELCRVPFENLAICHSVCKTPEGFVITGGEDTKLCAMFIAATMSWVKLQNLPRKRHAHGSIWVKGVIWVFGGSPQMNWKSVSRLEGGSWETGPDLPFTMKYPKVAEINGFVYLLDEDSGKLLRFDVDTKEYTKMATIPGTMTLQGVSMIPLQGKLRVFGAWFSKASAWYNPATNSWSKGRKPLELHAYGALVYFDNRLLLLGGNVEQFGGTDDVEEITAINKYPTKSTIEMPDELARHFALVMDLPIIEYSD